MRRAPAPADARGSLGLEHFNEFGLRVTEAVAGFCGGVSYVFVTRNTKPFEAIGSVVVGCLTANYLAGYLTGMTGLAQPAAGFVTGLCAMAICQGIIAGARRWRVPEAKGGSDV